MPLANLLFLGKSAPVARRSPYLPNYRYYHQKLLGQTGSPTEQSLPFQSIIIQG